MGIRRRRRLKGIHSRSYINRTVAKGLSFYYPRLLHCLNQMLSVVLLSQHRVSSKTVRPRVSCGACPMYRAYTNRPTTRKIPFDEAIGRAINAH